MDNIKIVWGDSAFTPFDLVSGSSRSTWHAGNALLRACKDAKRQLFELVAPQLGVNPEDFETRDWQIYARRFPDKSVQIGNLFTPLGFIPSVGEILGKGEYSCPYVPEEPDTGQSERPVAYYSYGAYGVEVAVNIETGELKVVRIGACFDMGQPINPAMCEQQIEGGIGMGIGAAIYEELHIENGVLLNPNFMEYKLPTSMEIPSGKNAKAMLAGVPHSEGPLGAKGLGEAVLVPLLPAVGNAFYNATGVRIKDLSLNRERIFKALKEAGKAQI